LVPGLAGEPWRLGPTRSTGLLDPGRLELGGLLLVGLRLVLGAAGWLPPPRFGEELGRLDDGFELEGLELEGLVPEGLADELERDPELLLGPARLPLLRLPLERLPLLRLPPRERLAWPFRGGSAPSDGSSGRGVPGESSTGSPSASSSACTAASWSDAWAAPRRARAKRVVVMETPSLAWTIHTTDHSPGS